MVFEFVHDIDLVFGVNTIEPGTNRIFDRLVGDTENLFETVREESVILFDIPVPKSFIGAVCREFVTLFEQLHRLLGTVFFADIDDNTEFVVLLFIADVGDIDNRVDRFADIVFDLRFKMVMVQRFGLQKFLEDFLFVGAGKFIEDFIGDDLVMTGFVKDR